VPLPDRPIVGWSATDQKMAEEKKNVKEKVGTVDIRTKKKV